jgi:polysaccharide pyruvyl transferase WcaK-like protein
MSRIIFAGYYGLENSGDDSFIEVASWGSEKYWNQNESVFLSKKLPIITTKASSIGENKFIGHFLLKSYKFILQSNAFICAGGSTFHSELIWKDPRSIARIKKLLYPKYKFGAIGVSIGPYKNSNAEKEIMKLFKSFDFLALRDKKSYELALSYNLNYTPINAFDLAALLPDVYEGIPSKKNNSNPKRTIGVSLCRYESFVKNGNLINENRRNEEILKLLNSIAHRREKIKFRFFIFNGHPIFGDKEITIETISKLRLSEYNEIEVVDYDSNVYNTWVKVKQCDVFVATRLHAANFACFAEVPFFLIEYHRKCSDFLDDIGYHYNNRLQDAHFDVNSVSNKIIEISEDTSKFLKPTLIDQSISKARLNFSKIDLND